jgi:hypothetical protein
MSKGISRQQQAILGLAAATNRIRHASLPDVSVALASALLGGVGLRTVGRRHTPRITLDDSPQAHSIRSAIAKGCVSLVWRGLLAAPDWSAHGAGLYNLTEAGLAIGRAQEAPAEERLTPWLWLLFRMPIARWRAEAEGADPASLPQLPDPLPTLPRHLLPASRLEVTPAPDAADDGCDPTAPRERGTHWRQRRDDATGGGIEESGGSM